MLTHSPQIVRDGLVLHLDAANPKSYPGSGTTWFDLSGNGNDSTLLNSPSYNSDNNGIFILDRVNDRIQSPNLMPSEISVEVFFKWSSLGDSWLISNQQESVISYAYGFLMRIDYPSYNFYWWVGNGSSVVRCNHIIELNKWYHIVGTANSVETTLYFNGELKSSNGPVNIDYTDVLGVYIGGSNQGDRLTSGSLGLVKIYDKALSASEIKQNFEAYRDRYGI